MDIGFIKKLINIIVANDDEQVAGISDDELIKVCRNS
jgi:hypothetical protein